MSIEVKVPDIGDFKDIPVIEIFVKPGDSVKPEDSLVTLESDKATMDVPSPAAGIVKELKVKLGDKVSEGSVIVVLEGAATGDAKPSAAAAASAPAKPADSPAPAAPAKPAAAPVVIPGAATYAGKADIECEMLVLGAGPGRLQRRVPFGRSRHEDRARRALRDARRRVPQRRLHSVEGAAAYRGGDGRDQGLRRARRSRSARRRSTSTKLVAWKDKVVGKLTGGLAGMAKARKVDVVRGYGVFLDPHHIEVDVTDGANQNRTGVEEGRQV